MGATFIQITIGNILYVEMESSVWVVLSLKDAYNTDCRCYKNIRKKSSVINLEVIDKAVKAGDNNQENPEVRRRYLLRKEVYRHLKKIRGTKEKGNTLESQRKSLEMNSWKKAWIRIATLKKEVHCGH